LSACLSRFSIPKPPPFHGQMITAACAPYRLLPSPLSRKKGTPKAHTSDNHNIITRSQGKSQSFLTEKISVPGCKCCSGNTFVLFKIYFPILYILFSVTKLQQRSNHLARRTVSACLQQQAEHLNHVPLHACIQSANSVQHTPSIVQHICRKI